MPGNTRLSGLSETSSRRLQWLRLLPGLILTTGIAAAAFALHRLPGMGAFSPMIIAILLGMAIHNTVGTPAIARPGVVFSMKKVLRLGIILLGLQLTAAQVAAVGFTGVVIIVTTLVATFFVIKWLGRLFGVDAKLTELIAAGTSICGASAVIATNTVTEAHDEDVAYAVACVTVFGSLSMFLFPLLPGLLHLDPQTYGLWAGAAIHEIAQVVAAAFQAGEDAGQFGTVAKLTRVMMLAPMIIALGLYAARRRGRADATGEARKGAPLPWFVLGFIALVGVNSVVDVPDAAMEWIVPLTAFLLTLALGAMGLEASIAKLRAKGLRPLAVAGAGWVFILLFSLALIKLAL